MTVSGANSRSFVLTYHSLDASGSPISVAPATFARQMEYLAAAAIPVVPLREVTSRAGAVAITFDDGFANFAEQALPVLSRLGFPATVFAVPGYCGRRNDWPTQSPGIPLLPILSWEGLGEVARAGVEIGAHTMDHPRLTELEPGEAERQMRSSQAILEDRLGKPVRHFAYPYGDVDAGVRRMAGRYFDTACSVELDYIRRGADALSLPRLDAYYLQSPFWFERAGRAEGAGYIWLRRQLRAWRAIGRATRFR